MKGLYWRLYIAWLSLRWIPSLNLGDLVIFGGREWVLVQGVRRPYWDLANGDEKRTVHEGNIRKVRRISNYWRSFRSGYRFYMVNWYGIWIMEGIKPWMRGCNIWKQPTRNP